MYVKPKKHLGQHFLKDEEIAFKIVESLKSIGVCKNVLEIGPGTGVLTKYLLEKKNIDLKVVELDEQSVEYLLQTYPYLKERIISSDFLQLNLNDLFENSLAVIGNFPYNISSQILFKILDHRDKVVELVGMFQKEVAERVVAKPKSKAYGIISILLQRYYSMEYLFTVDEGVFDPPPKVKSGVIRLVRNETNKIDCNEDLFIKVVKTAFNQRRKILRNALKVFEISKENCNHHFFSKRAEELAVYEFVELTNIIDKS